MMQHVEVGDTVEYKGNTYKVLFIDCTLRLKEGWVLGVGYTKCIVEFMLYVRPMEDFCSKFTLVERRKIIAD